MRSEPKMTKESFHLLIITTEREKMDDERRSEQGNVLDVGETA